MADAANRAKSEFLSRMSRLSAHAAQYRAGVCAVACGWIAVHLLTDGQRSKVELRRAGARLGVISDVLDLFRIDSGQPAFVN